MGNNMSTIALESLKMVQGVIARLANNSFLLKGWTITTVVVTMLLGNNSIFIKCIAFIPILMFWFLDTYYLYQERLFRKLHNWIIENADNSFPELFDFNVNRFKKRGDYFKAFKSGIEAGFYLPIAILTFAIIIIIKFSC